MTRYLVSDLLCCPFSNTTTGDCVWQNIFTEAFSVSMCSGPYHSREQSTDSGLGLGCYSIPTTPEDFLGNVDEMDTGTILSFSLKCNDTNNFVL